MAEVEKLRQAMQAAGDTTLPVVIRTRVAVGRREEVEVKWPAYWQLPLAGQMVGAAIVRQVIFDLARNRIVLDCD